MVERDPHSAPTHNTVTGPVSGKVVQAGTVTGGVHFHEYRYETAAVVPRVVAVVTRLRASSTASDGVFFGRDTAAERVFAALAPDTHGRAGAGTAVVVAGMGGVGKTALARHCAVTVVGRGWFPGGALWTDLQGYSPTGAVAADAVLSPLLRQLGVPDDRIPSDPAGQATVYDRTLHDLDAAGQPVLLVLDNVSAVEQLHGLLPAGGAHRVIVTTRETLALPDARRLSLDTLSSTDAVTVLNRALRRQDADDDRVDTDRTGATRLAEVCGHLPLALLIAAGLLTDEPALIPGVLADQLTRASTAGFVHGENLAAVLTTSLNQLRDRDPHAAGTLRLVALAPGEDISTDAAAALADVPVGQAQAQLRVLRQAHLLLPSTAVDRWRMHDLVRRHTLEHTHTPDGDEHDQSALTRLLDHYFRITHDADMYVRMMPGRPLPDRFTDRAAALAWLDAEHPNLVAAVGLAASTQRHTHTTRLSDALHRYLVWRRHLIELLTVNELGLAAAHHLNDAQTLATVWDNLGHALCEVRRFDEAITAHETARDIFRELGNRLGEGRAWNNLGIALHEVRRFDEAITAHETARDIFREVGDRHGEGRPWINLGRALWATRRFDEAITAHETARDIFRELGDRHGEGVALDNLGFALQTVERFDESITANEAARDICREIRDRYGEGVAENGLGVTLRAVGRFDEAITAHETARDIFQELGDRYSEGMALNDLGCALWDVERFDEAITVHETARDIFQELGDRHGEGIQWDNLGHALQAVRRFEQARASWEQALAAYRATGDTPATEAVLQNLDHLPGRRSPKSPLRKRR